MSADDGTKIENSLTSPTRRRTLLWKCNIRKRLRQMGEAYVDSKGIQREARNIGDKCPVTCHYECTLNFGTHERTRIHKLYWSLNNDEKKTFMFKYINRIHVKRPTKLASEPSRRSNTFCYYFALRDKHLQVCKKFYLNTLGISSKVVYNLFKKIPIGKNEK